MGKQLKFDVAQTVKLGYSHRVAVELWVSALGLMTTAFAITIWSSLYSPAVYNIVRFWTFPSFFAAFVLFCLAIFYNRGKPILRK